MEIIEFIKEASKGETFLQWFIVFGLGLGLILGSIVLAIGLKKKKKKIAIIGFFSVLVSCSGVGFVIACPLAIFFIWLILKPEKDKVLDAEEEEEDLSDIELDEEDLKEEK